MICFLVKLFYVMLQQRTSEHLPLATEQLVSAPLNPLCSLFEQKNERTPFTRKIKSQLKIFLYLGKIHKKNSKASARECNGRQKFLTNSKGEIFEVNMEKKTDIFWIWSGIERYRRGLLKKKKFVVYTRGCEY